ncbi:hypothetical protein D3C71_21690 [compost metagenome]
MAAYVYILRHRSEPRLKVGKAKDLLSRIQQLGADQFDFASSDALEVSDASAASNLERILHRVFSNHRLAPDGAPNCPQLRTGSDGATEWFELACLERMHAFLAHCEDLVDFTRKPLAQAVGSSAIAELEQRREKAALAREQHNQQLVPRMHAQHQQWCQQFRQDVQKLAAVLAKVAGLSEFAAVVSDGRSYALVGEVSPTGAAHVDSLLDIVQRIQSQRQWLGSLVGKAHLTDKPDGGKRFCLQLEGAPGGDPEDANDDLAWRRRAFWRQDLAVPGFALPIGWQQAKRAAAILQAAKEAAAAKETAAEQPA